MTMSSEEYKIDVLGPVTDPKEVESMNLDKKAKEEILKQLNNPQPGVARPAKTNWTNVATGASGRDIRFLCNPATVYGFG